MIGSIAGFPGGLGSGDSNYVHSQDSAITMWDVTHNLGKRPSVVCFNQDNIEMKGQLMHVNDNRSLVIFNNACAGKAYFN